MKNIFNSIVIITIAFLLISLFDLTCKKPYTEISKNKEISDREMWFSLINFEKFMVQNEDDEYGYKRMEGYPLYLADIAATYFYLYLYTQNDYYRRKLLRVGEYILKIRNNDWSWDSYPDGIPNALYNCVFSDRFLAIYKIEKDKKYLNFSKNTIERINNSPLSPVYNGSFKIFLSILKYCYYSGDRSPNYLDSEYKHFKYAISGFSPSSGKWYYSEEKKKRDFYDGHSAFYQLVMIYNFLENLEEVKIIFPGIYHEMVNLLPIMISTPLKYLTPFSTFFYSKDIQDYTESAGIVLITLLKYDQKFKTNHIIQINNAKKTILKRQGSDSNGGFWTIIDGKLQTNLFYSDSIGKSLAQYFCLLYYR